MAYRPDQRTIQIRAVTTAGFIEGLLHVPKTALLLDHLNKGHEMLSLTDARVRDAPNRLPFLALRRSQCLAIIVPEDEDVSDAYSKKPNLVEHRVMCLAVDGSIGGRLSIVKDVRVSDFLQNQQGFIVLNRAKLSFGSMNADVPIALVYAPLVVAVTEIPK